MTKFLIKILTFSIPAFILVAIIISIDFFKIFGFQDYYSNQKVGINREMVTTKTFNHYREKEKFDSFIFGSSRSHAYKCKIWTKYLDNNSKAFHFDANSEGIWGISKKIEYINEQGDTIKNALVIIDRQILRGIYPSTGHLFIPMPSVSKSSKLNYYFTFIKASLNIKFLVAYIDFSIFKTYKGYMGLLIKVSKYDHISNPVNCDIMYGYDKEIEIDSMGYYNKLIANGVFYDRPKLSTTTCEVTSEEKKQLIKIKNIFDKHNTKYKIVISPTYDQVPMEVEQLELLEQLFGQEKIHNFSGRNKFTDPISNFYEATHYRPFVANEIMDIIYPKK